MSYYNKSQFCLRDAMPYFLLYTSNFVLLKFSSQRSLVFELFETVHPSPSESTASTICLVSQRLFECRRGHRVHAELIYRNITVPVFVQVVENLLQLLPLFVDE